MIIKQTFGILMGISSTSGLQLGSGNRKQLHWAAKYEILSKLPGLKFTGCLATFCRFNKLKFPEKKKTGKNVVLALSFTRGYRCQSHAFIVYLINSMMNNCFPLLPTNSYYFQGVIGQSWMAMVLNSKTHDWSVIIQHACNLRGKTSHCSPQ